MLEKVSCSSCVGGFIHTAMGPKPCPYCGAKGFYYVNKPDYKSGHSGGGYSSDSYSSNTSDYETESNQTKKSSPLDWWDKLKLAAIIFVIIYILARACG